MEETQGKAANDDRDFETAIELIDALIRARKRMEQERWWGGISKCRKGR
jgi:hypothetical protein